MTSLVERYLRRVHCVVYDGGSQSKTLAIEAADEIVRLNAEIKRLRLSISEARATGRREGMESMISWHAKEIERLDEQIAENNAYRIRVGSVGTSRANKYCADNKYFHEKSIAAIRAAMEKEE